MRHFLAAVFGVLALIVFLISLALFMVSDLLEPPEKVVQIRPGVVQEQW